MTGVCQRDAGQPVVVMALGCHPARWRWADVLRRRGFCVLHADADAQLVEALHRCRDAIVLIGASLDPASDGLARVRLARQIAPAAAVVLVVSRSREETVIEALRAGVTDYLREPCSENDFAACVDRCVTRTAAGGRFEEDGDPAVPGPPRGRGARGSATLPAATRQARVPELLGQTAELRALQESIERLGRSESTVLITGETGTGKELTAQLIHRASRRRARAMVSINCAAVPDGLLESELFGYERGAFTGAVGGSAGKLMAAQGGTVFFDEIGDMTPFAQAKILRAIETKEVYRLGGRAPVALDFRLIAATNQRLEELIDEGRFRKDLYFRLNVARLHLPALRERPADIPLLLRHYVREFNVQFGRDVEGFTDDALRQLTEYSWPGNVRELRNLVEAVFVQLPAAPVTRLELPGVFRRHAQETTHLPAAERERVLAALFETNWNKSEAARHLHWSRMTLYRKLQKHRIVRADRSSARKRTNPL